MTTTDTPRPVHLGRNVKRLRELLDIKQETLATRLGTDWNQQRVSTLEGKEVIEAALLEELAKALEVPVAAIKNFDDKAAANYVNTFCEGSINHGIGITAYIDNYNLNRMDEFLKERDENKRLYEALLKEKDEKIALLQKMVEMLEKK